VSNAIVALQAGANWISTSLLGIGERTGITPLSSLLANILILDPAAAGATARRLAAAGYVARLCGSSPPHPDQSANGLPTRRDPSTPDQVRAGK
jgi:isopropylmalate/homocitrate/citramalate synthase